MLLYVLSFESKMYVLNTNSESNIVLVLIVLHTNFDLNSEQQKQTIHSSRNIEIQNANSKDCLVRTLNSWIQIQHSNSCAGNSP